MRDGQDVDEELIHAKDDVSAKRSNTIAFQISEFYMKFDVDENCDVCEGFSDLARRDFIESPLLVPNSRTSQSTKRLLRTNIFRSKSRQRLVR
jgi:hypothetical protein